jgi:putative tryptophan/tyrosine transport system substrate-binding protein
MPPTPATFPRRVDDAPSHPTAPVAWTRRRFQLLLAATLAPFGRASAQGVKKTYRVGVLTLGDPKATLFSHSRFRDELARLGLAEGVNLAIDIRSSGDDPARLEAAAAELVATKPDVIVIDGGTRPALAAKRATTTIPIIFGAVGDPVARGLVASLARPGGNLTGNAIMSDELDLKRAQFLLELLRPGARIAMVASGRLPEDYKPRYEQRMIAALGASRVRIFFVDTADALTSTFERIAEQRLDAVAINATSFAVGNEARIAELIARYRLPAIGEGRGLSLAGVLLSYSTDRDENDVRTAGYLHKVLTGANPADLPVQQTSKLDLIVNLKTARMLGLKIPAAILARADEVLE